MTIYRISYLLVALLSLMFFAGLDSQLSFLFNADNLHPAALYQDLVLDGNPIREWSLTPAPYFFPDLIAYFPIRWLTGDLRTAAVVYCILQLLLILWLANKCAKIAIPGLSYPERSVANISVSLFILSGIIYKDWLVGGLILSISCHLGSLVNGLFILLFLLRFMYSGRYRYLVAGVVFSLAAIISDKLILILFFIPAIISIGGYSLIKRTRRSFITLLMLITVLPAGWFLFELINHRVAFIPDAQKLAVNSSETIKLFAHHIRSWLAPFRFMGAVFILSIISVVFHFLDIRRQIHRKNWFLAMYRILILSSAIIVFFAAPLLGLYQGFDSLRYNIHALILLVFHLPLIILPALTAYRSRQISTALILSLILVIMTLPQTWKLQTGLKQLTHYRPELVEELDMHSDVLKNGIADYWLAKDLTLFSQKGIRGASVHPSLRPYIHEASGLNYTGRREPIVFNFIVDFNPGQEGLIAKDTLYLSNHTVYIVEEFIFRKGKDGRLELANLPH